MQIRIQIHNTNSLPISFYEKEANSLRCTIFFYAVHMIRIPQTGWLVSRTVTFLTINAPLILKMRDINFVFAALGTILGSKKSRPPRNIPRNGPLCNLPKKKKNNVPNFQKSAVHWYFYVPLRPSALNFITL